jgi:hypothetical protein
MTNSTNQTFSTAYRAVLTAVFVGIADVLIPYLYNSPKFEEYVV